MHQWLVILRVQVVPVGEQPPIVIKVQMSDEAYQTYDPHFRIQLVDRVAKETLVAANGKIWPIHTVPYSIETVETWPINPPIPETASPDHVTFTTLSTWVKEPTSPFPAH